MLVLSVVAAPAAAQPLGSPQQVSFTEPLDDPFSDSTESAIAYGGGRSLIVWEQRTNEQNNRGVEYDRTTIMGRFVNGAGAPISNPFRIDDNPEDDEHEITPDVAYDSTRDRFFVVWDSEFIPPELETRTNSGRLLRGARVAPSGDVSESVVLTPDMRFPRNPAVSYGSTSDEFLVAYDFDGEVHIRKVGAENLDPQDEGQDITEDFEFARNPDTAFDPVAARWLVVFEGAAADRGGRLAIHGRSFDANLDGSDAVQISQDDNNGKQFTQSREPAVAGDETGGGFMVVYEHHFDREFELPEQKPERQVLGVGTAEIFARRVTGGGELGGDARQVSDDPAPPESFSLDEFERLRREARRPDVWHDPNADQFLVTWAQQTRTEVPLRNDFEVEYEVFGKKIDNAAAGLQDEQRISNHRPNEEDSGEFDGDLPAVTYDRTVCDYVVSWTGEEVGTQDEEPGRGQLRGDEKQEIWDRPYDAPSCPGAAEPASAAAGSVAASRVCTSRRNFPIRLVKRRDRDYEFALVKVNGQPVNVTYGDRVRSQVNLIGLPVGRYSVDIEARLESGRTLKGVRRYFTCNRKLPPSNGLDRPEAL